MQPVLGFCKADPGALAKCVFLLEESWKKAPQMEIARRFGDRCNEGGDWSIIRFDICSSLRLCQDCIARALTVHFSYPFRRRLR